MIVPITDAKSHAKALDRIEALWDAQPGSPEERELDALATLVDAYEKKAFPILPPDPIAAILARSQQLAWKRSQLEPLIGSRARVSEVLGGKHALTLSMIRRLHTAMGIPAEILIAEPVAKRARRAARPGRAKATTASRSQATRRSA